MIPLDYSSEIVEFDDDLLVPCKHCHRTFREEVVEKHTKVCETVWRKTQVVKKTEHRVKSPLPDAELKAKRNNWRLRHRSLQAVIQSAKGYREAGSFTPPPCNDPSLVQCPTCERRYSEKTAERHFNYCRERKERLDLFKTTLKPRSSRTSVSTPIPPSDDGLPSAAITTSASDNVESRQLSKESNEEMTSPEIQKNPAQKTFDSSELPAYAPSTSLSPESVLALMNQILGFIPQVQSPQRATVETVAPIKSQDGSQDRFPSICDMRFQQTSAETSQFPCFNPLTQQQLQQVMAFQSLSNLAQFQSGASISPNVQPTGTVQSVIDNTSNNLNNSPPQSLLAKFCCGCGSAFTSKTDKFCSQCGAKRVCL